MWVVGAVVTGMAGKTGFWGFFDAILAESLGFKAVFCKYGRISKRTATGRNQSPLLLLDARLLWSLAVETLYQFFSCSFYVFIVKDGIVDGSSVGSIGWPLIIKFHQFAVFIDDIVELIAGVAVTCGISCNQKHDMTTVMFHVFSIPSGIRSYKE